MARVLAVLAALCVMSDVATAFGPGPGAQCFNVTANTCCKPNKNLHLITIANVSTTAECCGKCQSHSKCTVWTLDVHAPDAHNATAPPNCVLRDGCAGIAGNCTRGRKVARPPAPAPPTPPPPTPTPPPAPSPPNPGPGPYFCGNISVGTCCTAASGKVSSFACNSTTACCDACINSTTCK